MLTYVKVLGVTFGTSAEAARVWDHAVIRQYGGNFSFDCLNFEDSFDDVLHLLSQGQVLAYAHVCSRMLTYAHVCSRDSLDDVLHLLSQGQVLPMHVRRWIAYADVC
jgi:hypothetical protein